MQKAGQSDLAAAELRELQYLADYSPSMQLEICADADRCFFGDYPTLAELNRDYNPNMARAWLIPQLTNLSEYCGAKDKLTGAPLTECAFVIATTYYYMKVSELMLFFFRFKQGRYGRFYGNIDPLIITTSLAEFARERQTAIERKEREDRAREREEWRKNAVPMPDEVRARFERFVTKTRIS